jgi:hypothetical protein
MMLFVAVFGVRIASVAYLRPQAGWDDVAKPPGRGVLLGAIVLVSGSIWGGRLGVWWQWDQRLTTSPCCG